MSSGNTVPSDRNDQDTEDSSKEGPSAIGEDFSEWTYFLKPEDQCTGRNQLGMAFDQVETDCTKAQKWERVWLTLERRKFSLCGHWLNGRDADALGTGFPDTKEALDIRLFLLQRHIVFKYIFHQDLLTST